MITGTSFSLSLMELTFERALFRPVKSKDTVRYLTAWITSLPFKSGVFSGESDQYLLFVTCDWALIARAKHPIAMNSFAVFDIIITGWFFLMHP